MLLLIDHLALRARNYEYLIRLFQEWEVGLGVGCPTGATSLLPVFVQSPSHALQGWLCDTMARARADCKCPLLSPFPSAYTCVERLL